MSLTAPTARIGFGAYAFLFFVKRLVTLWHPYLIRASVGEKAMIDAYAHMMVPSLAFDALTIAALSTIAYAVHSRRSARLAVGAIVFAALAMLDTVLGRQWATFMLALGATIRSLHSAFFFLAIPRLIASASVCLLLMVVWRVARERAATVIAWLAAVGIAMTVVQLGTVIWGAVWPGAQSSRPLGYAQVSAAFAASLIAAVACAGLAVVAGRAQLTDE